MGAGLQERKSRTEALEASGCLFWSGRAGAFAARLPPTVGPNCNDAEQ